MRVHNCVFVNNIVFKANNVNFLLFYLLYYIPYNQIFEYHISNISILYIYNLQGFFFINKLNEVTFFLNVT